LPYIESLNLYKALQVTDAGLKHLEHLTRMRVLNLEGTSMTDAGLQSLRAMSHLEELSLCYQRMPGRGLEPLRQFGALRKLSFECLVADADLRQLKYLTGLRQLNLMGSNITDAGLEQLKDLTQLEELNVSAPRVTPAGVTRFRFALPRCKVDWTGWRHEGGRGTTGQNGVRDDNGDKSDTTVIPLLPGTHN
jgi:hypothetical protein